MGHTLGCVRWSILGGWGGDYLGGYYLGSEVEVRKSPEGGVLFGGGGFYLELTLQEYQYVSESQSKLAAAALWIALSTLGYPMIFVNSVSFF